MKTQKHIGIWMDHASAHLMELVNGPIETKTIGSAFTSEEKEETIERSEKEMHHKENHDTSAYYKTIGKAILEFDDVLLFGPTNARIELFNLLRADHHFDKINIETRQTDKMTENQEHAFVRDHFSKQ